MDIEQINSDLDVLHEYLTSPARDMTPKETHEKINEFVTLLKKFFQDVSPFVEYYQGLNKTLQDIQLELAEAKGSGESIALGQEVKNKLYEIDTAKGQIPKIIKKYTKLFDRRQRHNIINQTDSAVRDPAISKIFQKQIKVNITNIGVQLLNINANPSKNPKTNLENIQVYFQALETAIPQLLNNLEVLYQRRNPPAARQYRIEASDYFRSQKEIYSGNEFRSVQIGLDKIKGFAFANQIPNRIQAAEPHCYGKAPNHLNGVVMSDKRLIFYMYPDDTENVIRLCAFIDSTTHNRAWDANKSGKERPSNLYWCIMTDNQKHKIQRDFFEDFKEIDGKTLQEL